MQECEASEMREHMKEILLLGTYIKRSANLYFLSQEYEKLPQQELRLTIDELVRAMILRSRMWCGLFNHKTDSIQRG